MSPGTDNLFRTSTAKSSIMVVDDNPSNLRVLTQILTEHGYRVRPVKDSHLVMSGIKAQPPDLILMDVRMPGMNGYELCQILKDDESTQNIPVIFISALDSIQDKVTAFRLGGVDYITKPFHMEEVLVRVGTQIALKSSTEQLQKANQKLMQWNQDLESRLSKS